MKRIIELTKEVDRLTRERDEYSKTLSGSTAAYREKIKELSTIRRMLGAMKFIPDRGNVCKEIVNIIIDETVSDSCQLWLIADSGKNLELAVTRNQVDDSARYFEPGKSLARLVEVGKGVVGRVASIGKTILLKKINLRDIFCRPHRQSEPQAVSVLCLPIKDKEKVIAVLSLSHPEKSTFSQEARRIYELAVAQASVVLASLAMFENIQSLNNDLEKMVEQRTNELHHQARHDALTGLANRLLFDDRLVHSISRAQRDTIMLTVICINVGNFKRIIGGLGHSAADWLLKEMATRLIGCLREVDTVSRSSGNEFAILLEEIVHEQEAVIVVRKLIKTLSRPFVYEGRELFFTLSAGLAYYPQDGQTGAELLKNGVNAMRHAKEQGKNNYQIFTRAMHDRAIERVDLEGDIITAIKKNELLAYYQPKIDLKSMQIVGMEALIRWRRKGVGVVSPADFVPMAEEIGFIVNIDEWILMEACKFAHKINSNGAAFAAKPLHVSVNLSARNFERPNLIESILEAVSTSGLSPGELELEVTESAIIRNMDIAINTLKDLRKCGFKVSVDDFGTGYCSLNYLTLFPLTTLKLDRSFVIDIGTNANSRSIAKAIIAMAQDMGIRVVAEGVETTDQLSFLGDHGCDEVQGFMFSRPVPEAEFLKLPSDYN